MTSGQHDVPVGAVEAGEAGRAEVLPATDHVAVLQTAVHRVRCRGHGRGRPRLEPDGVPEPAGQRAEAASPLVGGILGQGHHHGVARDVHAPGLDAAGVVPLRPAVEHGHDPVEAGLGVVDAADVRSVGAGLAGRGVGGDGDDERAVPGHEGATGLAADGLVHAAHVAAKPLISGGRGGLHLRLDRLAGCRRDGGAVDAGCGCGLVLRQDGEHGESGCGGDLAGLGVHRSCLSGWGSALHRISPRALSNPLARA